MTTTSSEPRGELPAGAAAGDPAQPGPRPARRRALGTLGLLAVIAAVVAIFFLPALVTDQQFLHRDTGRMHHPIKAWLAAELGRGHLPEWNPWGGMGYPTIGGAVDGVLHPFNLLLLILPFDAAFKAWVLLLFVIAGAGGALWARQLGARDGPALGAGLGFALSGYLVSSTDNLTYLGALGSLPLILAAAHAWLRAGGPGRLLLLGAASAFAAANGDPQSWGFTVAALPLYGAAVAGPGRGPRLRGALRGALAAAACAVAAAPFIVPVLAWMPHSSRGEAFDAIEYERFNLLPMRIAELVLPHLLRERWLGVWSDLYENYGSTVSPLPWVLSEYLGAAATALAILGAARSRAARALLAVAALAIWMAVGPAAGFGQLARVLPVLRGFRYWEKVAAFAHLLVPVAAAMGIAALAEGGRAARRFAAAAGAVAGVALAGHLAARLAQPALAAALVRNGKLDLAAILAGNLTQGLLHAGVALAAIALVGLLAARAPSPRLVAGLAVAVLATDLAVANVRAYVLYPPEAGARSGPIAAYLAGREGKVVTPFPLWASPAARLGGRNGPDGQQTADVASAFGARSLVPAWNVGLVGNFEAYTGMVPVRQQRFRRRAAIFRQLPGAGLWNVRWIVVPDSPARAAEMNVAPPFRVVAVDEQAAAFVVEVPHRPRAYLAEALREVDRRAAMEFALAGTAVATPESVLEAPVPAGYRPPRGEVKLVRDEGERVVLEARSDGAALLVLNDVFTTGWTAEVDGRPAEILPVNYLARGVWIGAGAHTVTFAYRTPGLRAGLAILAAGLAALAGWALLRARRRGASGARWLPSWAARLGAAAARAGAGAAPEPPSPLVPSRGLEAWLAGHPRRVVAGLAVAAAFVRLILVLQLAAGPLPRLDELIPSSDNHFFDLWGRRIAAGDLLQRAPLHPNADWMQATTATILKQDPDLPVRLGLSADRGYDRRAMGERLWDRWLGGATFYQEPLYPYLVGLTYAVTGAAPWHVFAWQLALGVLGVLVVHRLARRLFSETAALAAGTLALLAPTPLFLEVALLRDWPVAFATVAVALLVDRAAEEGAGRGRWLALGVGLGVAVLLKQTFLVVPPLMAAWRLATHRAPWPERLRVAGLAALGMAAALAPAVLRNLAVGVPALALNGSAAGQLAIYHTVEANPFDIVFGQAYTRVMAESGGGLRSFFAAARTHASPLGLALLEARKLLYAWHGYESPNNVDVYLFRQASPLLALLPVTLPIALPLAVVGVTDRRAARAWPVGIAVLASLPTLVLAAVHARHRAALVMALLPLAGAGVARLAGWIRARRAAPLATAAALTAVYWAWASGYPPGQSPRGHARVYAEVGVTMLKLGEPAYAALTLAEAVRLHPSEPKLWALLARARAGTGDLAAALPLAEAAAATGRDRAPGAALLRAELLAALGRDLEARAAARAVLQETPDDPGARALLERLGNGEAPR